MSQRNSSHSAGKTDLLARSFSPLTIGSLKMFDDPRPGRFLVFLDDHRLLVLADGFDSEFIMILMSYSAERECFDGIAPINGGIPTRDGR